MRAVVRAVAVATVALGLACTQATATDGNLYPQGPSVWAVNHQFTATVVGNAWQVSAGPLDPAAVGPVWRMNWGCQVAGAEIAAVLFGGLRTKAPSSLEVAVTAGGQNLWAEPDSAMPLSPAPGRAYDVRLPGGQCNVLLALTQVEARQQHQRTYFIDSPRILMRDLQPPAVSLGALPGGWVGAGPLRVGWRTTDNFGADGIAGQYVEVDGTVRWSGAPGEGDHAVDVSLGGLSDGPHAVSVRAAGDGTGAGLAQGQVLVDGTPPSATGASASLPGAPGKASFSWSVADASSGVASSHVELNAAADGSVSGPWQGVAAIAGPGQPHRVDAVSTEPVPDGLHAWRVRSVDQAGNVGVVAGRNGVVVDTAPPALELHSVPTGWIRQADVDLTATDNLQAVLGLGATEIEVNAATDGGESGAWIRRSTSSGTPGRRIVPLDLAGLEDGRHLMRVVVRNGGPFGDALAAERRATLRVDATPPAISRAKFTAGAGRALSVTWAADDARAGVATATVQWRDGSSWRTLAGDQATDGAGSMLVDASALPSGSRALRLVIADAAGNAAVRPGQATLSSDGLGSTAGDPFARLAGARLSLTMARARQGAPVRGRAVLVRRARVGARVPITGRLVDAGGRPVVGAEIQARGHRGRVLGRSLTNRSGRFRLLATAITGGRLRVGVPAGRRLLPARASTDVQLEVRPRVSLSASSTAAAAGQQVLFSGRLRPAPGEIGLGSRKGIVLEWLDPVRRTWRPVVNARLRADGTFGIPWTFGVSGLTIPMRVAVPGEVGWPLLPVRSRVIPVTVR